MLWLGLAAMGRRGDRGLCHSRARERCFRQPVLCFIKSPEEKERTPGEGEKGRVKNGHELQGMFNLPVHSLH